MPPKRKAATRASGRAAAAPTPKPKATPISLQAHDLQALRLLVIDIDERRTDEDDVWTSETEKTSTDFIARHELRMISSRRSTTMTPSKLMALVQTFMGGSKEAKQLFSQGGDALSDTQEAALWPPERRKGGTPTPRPTVLPGLTNSADPVATEDADEEMPGPSKRQDVDDADSSPGQIKDINSKDASNTLEHIMPSEMDSNFLDAEDQEFPLHSISPGSRNIRPQEESHEAAEEVIPLQGETAQEENNGADDQVMRPQGGSAQDAGGSSSRGPPMYPEPRSVSRTAQAAASQRADLQSTTATRHEESDELSSTQKRKAAEDAETRRSQRPRLSINDGQEPDTSPQTQVDDTGASEVFELDEKRIKRQMETIYNTLASRVREVLSDVNLDINDKARFVLEAEAGSLLEQLYQSLFKEEQSAATVMEEISQKVRAPNLLQYLIARFLFEKVFSAKSRFDADREIAKAMQGLGRLGPAVERQLRDLNTNVSTDTLLRRAFQSVATSQSAHTEEFGPQARRLASNLAVALQQQVTYQLTWATTNESIRVPDAYTSTLIWIGKLTEPIQQALALKSELSACREKILFLWPGHGKALDQWDMESTFNREEGMVQLTIFPGLIVEDGKGHSKVLYRARVVTVSA